MGMSEEQGAPPRVRGLFGLEGLGLDEAGSTPARAGIMLNAELETILASGAPPRVRGLSANAAGQKVDVGSTPARAGIIV